jgi:hypothetical protein
MRVTLGWIRAARAGEHEREGEWLEEGRSNGDEREIGRGGFTPFFNLRLRRAEVLEVEVGEGGGRTVTAGGREVDRFSGESAKDALASI